MTARPQAPRIAAIGASCIDIKSMAKEAIIPGHSIPVKSIRSPGGVARNVAENLVRLECDVVLVSRVGTDPIGDWLIESMKDIGIDTSLMTRSPDNETATFTAMLQADGDMYIGTEDMAIFEEATPATLVPQLPALKQCAAWFMDTNLPRDSIALLLQEKPAGLPVFVGIPSAARTHVLRGLFDGIDFLFANRAEASYLSGIPIHDATSLKAAGQALIDKGVKHVIITQGGDSVFIGSREGHTTLATISGITVRDVTGAGDSLIAATMAGYLDRRDEQRSLFDAVRMGIAAASITIESTQSVSPELNPQSIANRASRLAG